MTGWLPGERKALGLGTDRPEEAVELVLVSLGTVILHRPTIIYISWPVEHPSCCYWFWRDCRSLWSLSLQLAPRPPSNKPFHPLTKHRRWKNKDIHYRSSSPVGENRCGSSSTISRQKQKKRFQNKCRNVVSTARARLRFPLLKELRKQ